MWIYRYLNRYSAYKLSFFISIHNLLINKWFASIIFSIIYFDLLYLSILINCCMYVFTVCTSIYSYFCHFRKYIRETLPIQDCFYKVSSTLLLWTGSDQVPFVLTPAMVYAINGGEQLGEPFQEFVELCCDAFNILRRQRDLLLAHLRLVSDNYMMN